MDLRHALQPTLSLAVFFGSVAPQPRTQAVPSRAEAEVSAAQQALLERLDAAFDRGNERAFFDCFAADAHVRPLEVLRGRWDALGQTDEPLQRRSRVTRVFAACEQPAVVLEVEYWHPSAPNLRSVVHELAVLSNDPAQPRVRFLVDHDAEQAAVLRAQRGLLHCPPCNFALRTPPGWVAAAMSPRALCLDAVALHHPEHDLCFELGVQTLAAAQRARDLLAAVARELGSEEDVASVARIWQVPVASPADARVEGAQVSLALDRDRRADLYAVLHAGLAYLLAVHGSRAAFSAVPEAADVVAGFSLLDAEPGIRLVSSAIEHHTGNGCLDGDRYESTAHGVVVDLPAGWRHELRAEQLFTLTTTSPTGDGEARITAHAPPHGFPAWSAVLATRFATLRCREWLARATPSPLVERPPATSVLEWTVRSGEHEEGVQLVCAARILVVVQWTAAGEAAREALARMRGRIALR